MQIASKISEIKNLKRRKHILVVDDERDLTELLEYNLRKAGFEVTVVHDGRAAIEAAGRIKPDVVVLDVMLPELTGTEVATRLRTNGATSGIPILMLTAKTDEVDQVVGFAVGADDYVTKPFSVKVLLARVDALLRRSGEAASPSGILRLGGIEVNTETHDVTVDGRLLRLTLTEFRLLAALIQAGGRVLSRHSLMSKAMGQGVTVTERTIDVHITSIRKKLGAEGGLVRTVRGVGYRATQEPEAATA